VTYSDSSTAEKLHSRVGLAIDQSELALGANVTLIGKGGQTQVLPKLTSDWSGLSGLDVKTVVLYGDWNGATPRVPSVDSTLLLRTDWAFIDSLKGEIHHASDGRDAALKLGFSDLDTGLKLFGGAPLDVKAGLTVQDADEETDAISTLSSSLGLGDAIHVESDLHVATNASAPSVDAQLVYRDPVPFVQRVVGSATRDATGESHRTLSVLFPDISGNDFAPAPFKLDSQATLEKVLSPEGLATLSMGFQTTLSGFATSLLGGSNELSFKVERRLDANRERTSSLAYDHAWRPGRHASIGLDLKIVNDVDQLEPSMGIKWLAQF
ncbi:MAG TPA: hypothetical protein VFY39_08165, partial [Gammaproteobacteria bacterium]|nr:hypothetical protein [Gammaproteobacteria bacterium]